MPATLRPRGPRLENLSRRGPEGSCSPDGPTADQRPRHNGTMSDASAPSFLQRAVNLRALADLPGALGRLQAAGRTARMDVGPYPVAYVGRPASVRDLLDGRLEGVAERGRFYEDISRVIGKSSLVTCESDKHRRLRRAVAPAFRKEQVTSYVKLMTESVSAMCATWPSPGRVDLGRQMAALTLDIAARSLFGVDIAGELEAFSTILETGTKIFYRLVLPRRLSDTLWDNPYSAANRRLKAAQREVDRFVSRLVSERRQEPHRQDRAANLLDFLIEARYDDGAGLSEEEIRDQVVTFLFAGHETTAQALTWAFVALASHPDVARRLVDECDNIVGSPERGAASRRFEPEDLPHLTWARAVTSEVLRLYPPAWFLSREAAARSRVDGCPVPAGALLLTSPLALHRDPQYWERPLEFDPSRWGAGSEAPANPEAYFPFGSGRRNCIGSSFALTEIPLVLASVLTHWEVHVEGPEAVKARPTVTLRPSRTVRATVRRRRPR